MQWYIERIFPVERRIVKTVRPLVSRVTSLPIAGDRVFDAVERLHRNLDAVKKILTTEATSSVRLVVNPEKMVIAEARRTYTYLGLFGYRVDAVIVNRVLPPDVTDPYRRGRTSRRNTSPPSTSPSSPYRSSHRASSTGR